ncbi:MAG: hypothetical protein WKF97_01700 [Chitinophagaceae bacterium]
MKNKISIYLFSCVILMSCNNKNQSDSQQQENQQATEVIADTFSVDSQISDTNNTALPAVDTSTTIYCDFIEGRWTVTATSVEENTTFTETADFECYDYSKLRMKGYLTNQLMLQGEAVGSLYNLRSKNIRNDIFVIQLERDVNGMRGSLKKSFGGGSTYFYSLVLRR